MKTVTRDPLWPLEKRLLKKLSGLQGESLLVAVSGGRDSMALLTLLKILQTRLRLRLAIVHVHHGGPSPFRKQAQQLVKRTAKEMELPFYTCRAKATEVGTSEDSLRRFRHAFLRKMQADHKYKFVVFAHHSQDLLETRLIRLLRGTGPDGLKAMRMHAEDTLRPLLETSLEELANYAFQRKVSWLEDPSNREREPLRNFIRHEWLPLIESKRKGAIRNLHASLQRAVESLEVSPKSAVQNQTVTTLDRHSLSSKPIEVQRQELARFLRQKGVRDFSTSHLDEVIKRLKTTRKNFCFPLLKREWVVNAEQISLRSV